MFIELTFWISLLAIYYIFDGYLRLLQLICLFKKFNCHIKKNVFSFPKITVLVTVFNEAFQIGDKINNILTCEYPSKLLEIIIASDGSTDGTDEIVESIGVQNVKLYRAQGHIGKTDTQNRAIKASTGEIIIFTDADTRFEKNFLKEIVAPFSNSKIGCVNGQLLFRTDENSSISKSQGFYWKYELKLRELESDLGILAIASGACLAVRKKLFVPLESEYGEDCIVPLDIVLQNYKVIHATEAVAYDQMEHQIISEFNTRVRMTIRNFQGTMSRKILINPFKNFGYSFSLLSHKILRWMSPIFLIFLTISMFFLIERSVFYKTFFLAIMTFYLSAFIGWISEIKKWKVPLVKSVFSFTLANYGFLCGLFKVILGHQITSYRNSELK